MFDTSTPNGTVHYAPNGNRLTVRGRTAYNDGSVRLHILREWHVYEEQWAGRAYESMMVYPATRPSTPCYCDYAYHPKGH